MKRGKQVIKDNQGFGIVEVILIIVVVIALVIIFQEEITAIFEKAIEALRGSTDKVFNNIDAG